jgi:hypothetical protein
VILEAGLRGNVRPGKIGAASRGDVVVRNHLSVDIDQSSWVACSGSVAHSGALHNIIVSPSFHYNHINLTPKLTTASKFSITAENAF